MMAHKYIHNRVNLWPRNNRGTRVGFFLFLLQIAFKKNFNIHWMFQNTHLFHRKKTINLNCKCTRKIKYISFKTLHLKFFLEFFFSFLAGWAQIAGVSAMKSLITSLWVESSVAGFIIRLPTCLVTAGSSIRHHWYTTVWVQPQATTEDNENLLG